MKTQNKLQKNIGARSYPYGIFYPCARRVIAKGVRLKGYGIVQSEIAPCNLRLHRAGSWIQDPGSWIQDPVYATKGMITTGYGYGYIPRTLCGNSDSVLRMWVSE